MSVLAVIILIVAFCIMPATTLCGLVGSLAGPVGAVIGVVIGLLVDNAALR